MKLGLLIPNMSVFCCSKKMALHHCALGRKCCTFMCIVCLFVDLWISKSMCIVYLCVDLGTILKPFRIPTHSSWNVKLSLFSKTNFTIGPLPILWDTSNFHVHCLFIPWLQKCDIALLVMLKNIPKHHEHSFLVSWLMDNFPKCQHFQNQA